MCNNTVETTFTRGQIATYFGLNSTEMSNGDAGRYSKEMERLAAAGQLDRSKLDKPKTPAVA